MMLPAAAQPAPPASTSRKIHRLIVLAALPLEVRPFLRRLQARRRRDLGLPAWEFAAGEGRGLVACPGMGAEPARQAGVPLLERWRPDTVISLGFGGALTPDLPPGSLVLGESFWHYDPQRTLLRAVAAPAPPRPLAHLMECLRGKGLPVVAGSVVTTPVIIHKGGQGGPLRRLPYPVLDLETAVLAEAACALGLPFLSLRAITDAAGEEIPAFLQDAGGSQGNLGVLDALGWVADDPRRLRTLWHFWRRSRDAARQLALGLLLLLPRLVAAGQELEDQPGEKG